jgi:hypothetical protein
LSDDRPAAVIDIEKEGKPTGKLTVRLQRKEFGAAASLAVEQAKKDTEKLAPGKMTSHISDTVEAGVKVDLATGLQGVISLLDHITTIGDVIAEVRTWCEWRYNSLIILQVHPYAKMAWVI